MAGLGPAIHVFPASNKQDADARDKRAHDRVPIGAADVNRCLLLCRLDHINRDDRGLSRIVGEADLVAVIEP